MYYIFFEKTSESGNFPFFSHYQVTQYIENRWHYAKSSILTLWEFILHQKVPFRVALTKLQEMCKMPWIQSVSYISCRKWSIRWQKICTGPTFIYKKYDTILMPFCAINYEKLKYHEIIYSTKTWSDGMYYLRNCWP